MNIFRVCFLSGLLLLSPICQAKFQVYDSLLYLHKPNLSEFGLMPIPIVYEATLFSTNDLNKLPEQLNISQSAVIINQSGADKAIIDIERWPIDSTKLNMSESLDKYKKVITDLKGSGVRKAIGYYGTPPVRDYWRAISNPGSGKYTSWQMDNDNLQSLADAVDVLYPSLYTFYNDQEGWIQYAKAQINEARRLAKGKPVIVFLWPKFHDSNLLLKNHYLPVDFWRAQLETVKSLADGVVIWGGWKEEWNPNADWWIETLSFIKSINN